MVIAMYRHFFQILLMLCALAMPSISSAVDRYGEREMLARIVQELEHINSMLDQAESLSDPDARIQFQYGPLRRDLMTIRHGLETHLLTPDHQPRNFAPLSGDYRR